MCMCFKPSQLHPTFFMNLTNSPTTAAWGGYMHSINAHKNGDYSIKKQYKQTLHRLLHALAVSSLTISFVRLHPLSVLDKITSILDRLPVWQIPSLTSCLKRSLFHSFQLSFPILVGILNLTGSTPIYSYSQSATNMWGLPSRHVPKACYGNLL